jgi:hypothetical protein
VGVDLHVLYELKPYKSILLHLDLTRLVKQLLSGVT